MRPGCLRLVVDFISGAGIHDVGHCLVVIFRFANVLGDQSVADDPSPGSEIDRTHVGVFEVLGFALECDCDGGQVLKGTVEDTAFFPYISAADNEDDWTDPDVWRKGNPSFGITIDSEQFAEDCREA